MNPDRCEARAHIEVQVACEAGDLPGASDVARWAQETLHGNAGASDVTVRFVDEAEGAQLNKTFRRGSGPTNVLSFPFESPPGVEVSILGDIAICVPVLRREARGQRKTLSAHCAHLVVHGMLHLLGHDHQRSVDAERMEAIEVATLARLGFANPYVASRS